MRPRLTPLLACGVALPAALLAGACASPIPHRASTEAPVTDRQREFRVREDVSAPLNADTGWAGTTGENAAVTADRPFRLRIAAHAGRDPGERRYTLLVRRAGDSDWAAVEADDFPVPAEDSPTVAIMGSAVFAHDQPTERLIGAADAPYRPGASVVLEDLTPAWSGNGTRGEWEWPLVIRQFADDVVQVSDGTVFEFRLGDAEAHPLPADTWPRLRVEVPPGHLGGTFVETPVRIGPWEAANGDLYFIMEPSETDNRYLMMKSSDGGVRWAEVDARHRPPVNDLEGVASVQAGALIHQLHQTSEAVWYYRFATSDHPETPDRWLIQAELVATPQEPPTQYVDVAVRSDGSLVALYGGPDRVHLKTRTSGGQWGEETVLDAEVGPALSGPKLVRGAKDQVHLAYTGSDGSAWLRRLSPDGNLTPRVQVAEGLGTTENDVGSVLPLVYLPEARAVALVYRRANGELWSRLAHDDGRLDAPLRVSERRAAQNTVDSDQTAADLIAHDGRLHLLFVDADSGLLYHAHGNGHAPWTPAVAVPGNLLAQWVRGNALTRQGTSPVYGFVYDAGSDGGGGFNRFATLPLE
ncbi:hypothetical protein [Polycyclovorans algicola]|uniref:hypothetical protein n=1 Tax=Polycyclovorans algicola TaxID=616992 RepID=UPI0006940995|nr:hypothetical protein [Polycyclovorans algicola]